MTVVLVVLFGAVTALGLPEVVGAVTAYLAFVNVVLLVFNLVPAFPLDGGRVLRAWLWHRKGSLRVGTRTAAKFGSGFGFFLIGLGLLQLFQGQLIGANWSAVLGMFLRGVAQASYREVLFRRALEDKPVRYFMTEDPVTVSPELKLSPFVEDYLYRHHHKLYPVMEDGVLQGVVGPAEVRQVDRNEWNAVAVDRVMQRLDDVICLPPDASAQTALERMQQSGRSRMLVVETGNGDTRLLGILTLKDLIAFLSLKMELEEGEEDAGLQADIRG